MERTVAKAFRLLELLAGADGAMTVTRLADLTGLQKSNVHRLLSTLIALGYVRHGAAKAYEPTLRLWELGQQIYSHLDIPSEARLVLRRLVQQTGESAHIAIFDDQGIVYLDRVETDNPVRAYTAIGGRAPAYCTASGKILLAYQPEDVLNAVCKAARRHTPDTITESAALTKALAVARQRGFATNLGEYRENVAGLAAPVRSVDGSVLAAVGISGPLERLQPCKIESLAPCVIEAADAIARVLTPRL
jgi:IclR family transcriptional regulator, KDG regulon repressor